MRSPAWKLLKTMENAIYTYNRSYNQYVTGYPQRYEPALPDLGNHLASCFGT